MKVAALDAEAADAIAQLSDRIYGEPFRSPVADLAYNLERAQSRGDNYSIGLYDDRGRLRGYLLAWVQRSLLQDRPGPVLLIEDCCLDPDFDGYLLHLIECIVTALQRDGLEDYAIETVVNPDGLELIAQHEDELVELGYSAVASHQYDDPTLGCTMTWLRYLPEWQGESEGESEQVVEAEYLDDYRPS